MIAEFDLLGTMQGELRGVQPTGRSLPLPHVRAVPVRPRREPDRVRADLLRPGLDHAAAARETASRASAGDSRRLQGLLGAVGVVEPGHLGVAYPIHHPVLAFDLIPLAAPVAFICTITTTYSPASMNRSGSIVKLDHAADQSLTQRRTPSSPVLGPVHDVVVHDQDVGAVASSPAAGLMKARTRGDELQVLATRLSRGGPSARGRAREAGAGAAPSPGRSRSPAATRETCSVE